MSEDIVYRLRNYKGLGCKCSARHPYECSCKDAKWAEDFIIEAANEIERLKKCSEDWKQVAEAFAIELGNIDYAQVTYEDVFDGLYDKVRSRLKSKEDTELQSKQDLEDAWWQAIR
jgi:hypothetical protein